MLDKFTRERNLVDLLMRQLGIAATAYVNPNADGLESGVDVIAVVAERRIGIQVTEPDTGNDPGKSRGTEKKLAREAEGEGNGVYITTVQNDPKKLIEAIQRSIAKKSVITPAGNFGEVWLLLSCGLPEQGAIASTFVVTLEVAALNDATLALLLKSKYQCAFVHPIVGIERSLYLWSRDHDTWQKTVQEEPPETKGPSFFDVIKDPEWIGNDGRNADAKADRELAKVLKEIRERHQANK